MNRSTKSPADAPARTLSETSPFRVRVGVARPGASPKVRGFIGRVKSMVREHGGGSAGTWRRATGGRGGSAAARLPRRNAAQRVVVKTRIVKHAGYHGQGGAAAALREHTQYLARRTASEDGERGVIFDSERELDAEGISAFRESLVPDRHHFRIVVSPEFGSKLELKNYARELVIEMQRDLDTKLQWMGVAHYDTDDPHVHLLIRGKTSKGEDLVISRDYISHGMRLQAAEIATRHLGPRLAQDIERSIERELKADRVTARDRSVDEQAGIHAEGLMSALRRRDGSFAGEQERVRTLARLQYLESLGLAREVSAGIWRPDPNLIPRLKALSIRGDIIKTLHARLKGDVLPQMLILDRHQPPAQPIIGRVVARAAVDEFWDDEYLIVEGSQDKHYYVPLGRDAELKEQPSRVGAMVRIEAQKAGPGGEGAPHSLRVTRLSSMSLEDQTRIDGVTFLDQELARGAVPARQQLRGKGFDSELATALATRAKHLEGMGLAQEIEGRWRARAGFLDELYERELHAAHARLGGRHGRLKFLAAGQRLRGTVAAIEELPSGPHVVLAGRGEYVLVPATGPLGKSVGRRLRLSIGASPSPADLGPRALSLSVRYQLMDHKKTRGIGGFP
jgi:type IV secretory pathway VirD2 relaxase